MQLPSLQSGCCGWEMYWTFFHDKSSSSLLLHCFSIAVKSFIFLQILCHTQHRNVNRHKGLSKLKMSQKHARLKIIFWCIFFNFWRISAINLLNLNIKSHTPIIYNDGFNTQSMRVKDRFIFFYLHPKKLKIFRISKNVENKTKFILDVGVFINQTYWNCNRLPF